MSPKSNDKHPSKIYTKETTDTKEKAGEDRGKYWSDVAKSQGSQQPLEARWEMKQILLWSLHRDCSPANILILDFRS